MNWQDQLRALPRETQQRLLCDHIPQSVAESMAFESKPVSMEILEAQPARRKPSGTLNAHEVSLATVNQSERDSCNTD